MNALQEKLFLELRQTKKEIETSLKRRQRKDWLQVILEEELADVKAALTKLNDGCFGICEISGELIPEEFLTMIPTLKTLFDTEKLKTYYRKAIYSPS